MAILCVRGELWYARKRDILAQAWKTRRRGGEKAWCSNAPQGAQSLAAAGDGA
ncbi:hypothetical protein [Ancylobacter aquaticus]|uniref:hypothetical protein n=1 Tax=Ancylobacter aquaticus TaxID=100 RepID=UPI001404D97B|nr:hypothetical protein [Ancylobacter aquaticus]